MHIATVIGLGGGAYGDWQTIKSARIDVEHLEINQLTEK